MGPQAERVITLTATSLPQRTVFRADLALCFLSLSSACLPTPLPQFSLQPHKSLLIHTISSHLKKLSANPRRAERAESSRETGFAMIPDSWDREQVSRTRVHCQKSSHSLLSKAVGFPASLGVHPWILLSSGLPPIQPHIFLVLRK